MKCKNTRYDHECHPIYAAKYDGYCLNCANAGVPDLDGQIADLRAQVFGHCGTAVSDALTGRDEAHLRNCARDDVWLARVALAEIDRLRAQLTRIREATGHVIHKTAEECVGCGCFSATAEEAVAETLRELRAALAARDRQLAELRNAIEKVLTLKRHYPDCPIAVDGERCDCWHRDLTAALLPPTAKEEPRAETK